jgi:hypothetical protein
VIVFVDCVDLCGAHAGDGRGDAAGQAGSSTLIVCWGPLLAGR